MLYGLGGYFLGDNVHRLTGPIGPITLVLGLFITFASLVFLRRNEQRLEEAEHAFPVRSMCPSLWAELLRTMDM